MLYDTTASRSIPPSPGDRIRPSPKTEKETLNCVNIGMPRNTIVRQISVGLLTSLNENDFSKKCKKREKIKVKISCIIFG